MPFSGPRPQVRVRISRSPAQHYPVFVGRGILSALPRILHRLAPAHRYFLITDTHVASLQARGLLRTLRRQGLAAHLLLVPAGERFKTRAMKARLEDRMLTLGGGRDSAVLAVGGGMIGDLAGFTAATYLRGVPFVSVPTTLLAMVDAALGGKTAVDHPRGKNLIGAFHHPRAVLADVSVLRTLPEREYRCGLAEAVKTAVVGDAALFRKLERSSAAILLRHPQALEDLVIACARIKARVVAADERESGRRAILNFGHTLGHALERLSNYHLAHGEAVAIGMVLEARAAQGAGILRKGDAERIESLLRRFGLPVRVPKGADAPSILAAAVTDKKSRGGQLRYALPRRIGSMAAGRRWSPRALPPELVSSLLLSSD